MSRKSLRQKHVDKLNSSMCCPKDDPVFGKIYCMKCVDAAQLVWLLEDGDRQHGDPGKISGLEISIDMLEGKIR